MERMKLLGKTAPEGGIPTGDDSKEGAAGPTGYVPPHLRNRDGGGGQEEEKQQVLLRQYLYFYPSFNSTKVPILTQICCARQRCV